MEERLRHEWQGKSTAVIGLGVSNVPLIRFLRRFGAKVSGRDMATREALGERAAGLSQLGVELVLGDGYLEGLEDYDVVFLSPGVPKNLPQLEALLGKVELSSEIALVMRYCPAPIFGITGSSGKTTTTTLVGEMFRKGGFQTYVGGNNGTPLIEQVLDVPPEARVVLELSSFQLEQLTMSPEYALVTNISENHLDVHGNGKLHCGKRQIYRFQTTDDVAVFNWDDPVTVEMSAQARGRVYYFIRKQELEQGAFLRGAQLVWRDGEEERVFAHVSDIKLPGEHNLENVLAAAALAHLGGAPWPAITEVPHLSRSRTPLGARGGKGWGAVLQRFHRHHSREGDCRAEDSSGPVILLAGATTSGSLKSVGGGNPCSG